MLPAALRSCLVACLFGLLFWVGLFFLLRWVFTR